MKLFIATIFAMISFANAFSQEPDSVENRKYVTDFIACVRSKDVNKLSQKVTYPLERWYPIPAIKDKEAFKKRYKELFDDSLVALIAHSNPDRDWGAVGWRGIMLLDGEVWLQYDGNLIAINYQSQFEIKEREALIEKERQSLYPALKKYEEPACILTTKKYTIRIDKITDSTYRYASWPTGKKMSEKPDLVIENGAIDFEGTGGNHNYTFKNDGYIYECDIIVIGEDDSPPASLSISKGDKQILYEKAALAGS